MKAPLMMGGDPTNLSAASLNILNNAALIAVSKDKLGKTDAIRRCVWVTHYAKSDVAL